MNRNKKVICLAVFFLAFRAVHLAADEGMWLLPLIRSLNIDTMHMMGFRLSAEDIYSINSGSLKDAIVIFDNGCTAEIISAEGLLLTNHHCGYDAIQSHSTIEHNYLEDGFWAADRSEELPNEGLEVSFLRKIEDVTPIVLKKVRDDMDEDQRERSVERVADSLVLEATGDSRYLASVEPMFGGNNYYLFVYEIFTDVRLVGAPPSSIGKFGYDTDNWMWPRHTGDFSIFRVYGDRDGNPAPYAPDNVPLHSDNFLSVSLKGLENGDFTMVMGYPGSTDRYMTSWEVKELLDITNPNRIKIRGLRQDILMGDMKADEKVNIQYASKYFDSSNYWKYSIGQNEGLKRLKVMETKLLQEQQFQQWVLQDEQRTGRYGEALELIRRAVEKRAPYKSAIDYTYECLLSASEIISFAYQAYILSVALVRSPDNKKLIDSLAFEIKKEGENFYKDYHIETDMKVTPAMFRLFQENVPAEYHPEFFNLVRTKYKNDFNRYCEEMFRKSVFASQEKLNQFLLKPDIKTLEKDPAFVAAISVLELYSYLYYALEEFEIDYQRGHRLYVRGLMEMQPDRIFYPDANFTMRMTYGSVRAYNPRDAVHYDYFTTLEGVMAKEDTTNWEFIVPQRLKELYESRDYGPYGINGTMPVCFITTNDITGGNSGSPVLNADGRLVGLAFDGNWEAMSGDIIYEEEMQRCICVDIRYVLFIIDKFAGASHLLKEMRIEY